MILYIGSIWEPLQSQETYTHKWNKIK